MTRMTTLSRPIALALALLLASGTLPGALAARKDKAPKQAQVTGTVRGMDGAPAAGIEVVFAPLHANAAEPRRGTSDAKGEYQVANLPYGLWQVALVQGGKVYAGNRVIVLAPGKKEKANFELGPFTAEDRTAGIEPGQKVAGLETPATGIARLQERLTRGGLAWFRTGKGVATLIGGSALLVGLIILSAEDDDPVTTTVPAN